jgi:hypothetical protein
MGSEGSALGTGSSSAQTAGLILTETEWAELDSKDYPKIHFWTKESFRAYKQKKTTTKGESGIKDAEKARRGKNANLASERESMAFLQHQDGTPVLEEEAQAIANSMRKVFNNLLLHGIAPSVWSEVSSSATKYLYQEMYQLFKFLLLCNNHWKVEKLVSLLYSSWYHKIHAAPTKVKDKPESDVKAKDQDNGTEIGDKRKAVSTSMELASGTKPTKQAKIVSLMFIGIIISPLRSMA